MVSNKNQHFVPRCYLRSFSAMGIGSQINLFNIDRRKVIHLAPARHQCAKDYFYGSDPHLDNAIQLLERGYADALRRIECEHYVLTDQDSDLLRKFWLLQFLRTEAASIRSVQLFEAAQKAIGVSDTGFRLEIKKAVLHAMLTYAQEIDIMDDMAVCLVRNHSEIPFLTSDDPAVLTNRWYLERPSSKGLSFGLEQSGNLMILPLTPSILFLGYDSYMYTVRSKKGWTAINSASDVEAYNEQQMLNCRANIFFKEIRDKDVISEHFSRVSKGRPPCRHQIHTLEFDRSDGNGRVFKVVNPSVARRHGEMLVYMEAIYPTPGSWPKHLMLKAMGLSCTNDTAEGFVRPGRRKSNPEIGYRKAVIKGF